jgi:hypothetical protein
MARHEREVAAIRKLILQGNRIVEELRGTQKRTEKGLRELRKTLVLDLR